MRIFPLKLYLKKWFIAIPLFIALAMNFFSWLWIIMQIPRSIEQLSLHYNILFGVDYSGPTWKVYYIPLLGLSIIVINMTMGWVLYKKDVFIAQVLNVLSVFMQIFIVIASILVVYKNI